MSDRSLSIKLKHEPHEYQIHVGSGLLKSAGEFAAASLDVSVRSIVIVSNAKVFGLYGKTVTTSLRKFGFSVETFLIGDGERFKTMKTAEKLLGFLSEKKIGRADAIVALGGGVVGDLAGFASAVHLRGIRFLQIPTTLLAMIDSSVGGKTGVNSPAGKNLIGSFHQPAGVLIDVSVLGTLDKRELTAGFCEAVKHGALSGRPLLNRTHRFLKEHPIAMLAKHINDDACSEALVKLVYDQVNFKRKIVLGDETEDPSRTDSSSRKILNFGHTVAHALEKATEYRYLKHGEAVGYGVRFAAELSCSLDRLSNDDLNSLNTVLMSVGTLPTLSKTDPGKVLSAFAFDKKRIAGSLQWVLLDSVGNPVIVPSEEVPMGTIKAALKKILA